MTRHPLDEAAPAIAKWLAPFIAEELGLRRPQDRLQDRSAYYDDETCAQFVRELGISVLNRASDFFAKLEREGHVGSLDLAHHLSLGSPRNISGALTNSMKRRAQALGLDKPWVETQSGDGRTIWADRDGIAERMVVAIRQELHRRSAFLYRPGDECPRSGLYVAVTADMRETGREVTVMAGESFPALREGETGYQARTRAADTT